MSLLQKSKGNEDEHTIYAPVRRQDFHRTGSRSLPENLKVEDLLSGIPQANSSLEVGEKREDSGVSLQKWLDQKIEKV